MNTLDTKGAYTKIRKFMKNVDDNIKCINDDYWDSIFKEYFHALSKLDLKNSTIEQRLYYVLLLLRYFTTNDVAVNNLTISVILDYSELCLKHNWNTNLQSRNRAYIKHFLNWMNISNYIDFSGDAVFPFITWKKKISIKSQYTNDEVSKYLNSFKTESKKEKENYLIMCMVIYLGLRISDVVFLKLSNIDFINEKINIFQYKTNNLLILPLLDEIKIPLADYLFNVRPTDCNLDYLFVTLEKPYRHKCELRHQYNIASSQFKRAGIDSKGRKKGFHAFRHSFGTRMMNDNISIYSISKMLGHSSIEVTKAYLDIDTAKLKELALEVPVYE